MALLLPSAAGGQEPARKPPPEAPPAPLTARRTGAFEAVLALRSPESEADRWAGRFHFPGDLSAWDYDLAGERFSLYVPPDYDPDGEPFGVLVWVSPTDDGSAPPRLRRVLDERHLIWIGADGAGNARHVFVRAGLALDAALNVAGTYHVDPDRVFVSGLSGGGRVATMEAVVYPEVFAGGLPIVGVTTYLDVPLTSDPGRRVLRFPAPPTGVLARARRQPLVIMTGSGDFNREECRLAAAAYEQDGFTAVHLLDIEGMGHELPGPEDFARGVDLVLGAPPHRPASSARSSVGKFFTSTSSGVACPVCPPLP